jgi:hypothetical protein
MLKTNRLTIERDLFVFIWMDRSLISVIQRLPECCRRKVLFVAFYKLFFFALASRDSVSNNLLICF